MYVYVLPNISFGNISASGLQRTGLVPAHIRTYIFKKNVSVAYVTHKEFVGIYAQYAFHLAITNEPSARGVPQRDPEPQRSGQNVGRRLGGG